MLTLFRTYSGDVLGMMDAAERSESRLHTEVVRSVGMI